MVECSSGFNGIVMNIFKVKLWSKERFFFNLLEPDTVDITNVINIVR